MRASAKHKLLVSMLFPAFLLIGCDGAVTGPVDDRDDDAARDDGESAAGESAAKPAEDEFCFQYKGELVCPDEDDRRFAK